MSNETTALAAPNTGMSFSASDVEIPRLNVIQKMSDISGPIGSVVIDKDSVILEAEQKEPVVVVSVLKRWKEDIPFGTDVMPQIANTEDESTALAKDSSYKVIEFAEIRLLIPQPKGADDDLYPYPLGDKNYQVGRITVQKDAYRLTYKRLYTFHMFNPTVNVSSRLWLFGTELLSSGKYTWYVPTLSITKDETPAAALEFAARLSGGDAQ